MPPSVTPVRPGRSDAEPVAELLRRSAPAVLGTMVRRHGQFDACEDAVQEALVAASVQWGNDGVPDHPLGWLITVASRRLADAWRAESARHRRETAAAGLAGGHEPATSAADADRDDRDDTLDLLFLCCTPALTPESQVALTLRAVGGLTTAQIATAFLVPEATMTRRISRAKQRLAGTPFAPLTAPERGERLSAVMHVLYLIFNEGYTASTGPDLHRVELSTEALRLTRTVHRVLPDEGEVAGLLALMLLTDARRPARTAADGALVPLADQDRTRWDAGQISEGIALLDDVLPRSLVGPYQVQAAIAAVHAEAARADDTDWTQIAALYELLERLAPSPVVTVNRAVAVALTDGPAAALRLLDTVEDPRYRENHRLSATRAHLMEMSGDTAAARGWYETAARQTTSLPEQRYLQAQATAGRTALASAHISCCRPGSLKPAGDVACGAWAPPSWLRCGVTRGTSPMSRRSYRSSGASSSRGSAARPVAEDLVQETLVRVIGAANRVEPGMLEPYAVVTARNMVASMWKEQDRRRRNEHRVIDLVPPDAPDADLLEEEERV